MRGDVDPHQDHRRPAVGQRVPGRLADDQEGLVQDARLGPRLVAVHVQADGHPVVLDRFEEPEQRLLQALDPHLRVQFRGDLAEVLHRLLDRLLGDPDLDGRPGGVGAAVQLRQRELLVRDADAVTDPVVQIAGDPAALLLLRLLDLVEQEPVVTLGGLPDPARQALLHAGGDQCEDFGRAVGTCRDLPRQMGERGPEKSEPASRDAFG